MNQSHSIWVKLDRYPPVLVRLLARSNPTTLLSDHEIHLKSEGALTLADIKRLSYTPTWDEVPVAKMKSFCLACGIDFASRAKMRTLNRYLSNSPNFSHLRKHPQFPEFKVMLAEYTDYERTKSKRAR